MTRPTIKTVLLASLSALTITMTTGCKTATLEAKNIVCSEMDLRAECILQRARDAHGSIADPFDWTTSANELAIAYDTVGQSQKAYSLINDAIDRLAMIADEKRRDTATSELALSVSKLTSSPVGLDLIHRLSAIEVSGTDKKADINAKLVTARGHHDDLAEAATLATNLPGVTDSEDAYRGRTMREVAAMMAKSDRYDDAIALARRIDARFNYYQGIAMTDIMAVAARAGHADIVTQLEPEAEAVAARQENGYFGAGILRDIAYAMIVIDDIPAAKNYADRAKNAAKSAPKFQEQARSLSRVMTRLADAGWPDSAALDLREALSLARQEPSAIMQPYAFYEIAGSAAFAGETDLSQTLIIDIPSTAFGSASSLRAAAKRDLAWGMVRSGQLAEGISLAESIEAPRERVHALSRIVSLLSDPKMDALPRYL